MDSMFIASMVPLLPVSMAEMPSIIRLFCDAPPRRANVVSAPRLTPGANSMRLVKFCRLIGRFSICSLDTAKERSALCDCTSSASALTFTVSATPPASRTIAGTPMRSPPLTRTPVRRTVLKESIVTSMV